MDKYLCLDCGEVYDDFFDGKVCPKSNCEGDVVEVDELMIPIIRMLNKKGYATRYCCSGHLNSRLISAYIGFYADCIPDTIDLPLMWHEDAKNYCIRLESCRSNNERDIYRYWLNAHMHLYDWVSNLMCNDICEVD